MHRVPSLSWRPYGGAAGYRPQVQNVFTLLQRLRVIYYSKREKPTTASPFLFLTVPFRSYYLTRINS